MRGNHYYPSTPYYLRRIAKAVSPARRQALITQWATATMGHVLPWCDVNHESGGRYGLDVLTVCSRNRRGLIRACRHLPPVEASISDLIAANDATGDERRSARSNVSKALKLAWRIA